MIRVLFRQAKHLIQYYLLRWHLLNPAQLASLGTTLRLEASSKCQLKCPLCLTGTGYHRQSSSVGWGHLSLESFQQILADNPQIKTVELSNYGEIFLNPQLEAMLRSAHEQGVKLTALNGVNLNYLSEGMAEALVKYQFEKLKVSIDGASEETYQIYRQGGSLQKVLANIDQINFYKKKYQSKYPKLKWQFIIFGHNEHELPLARQMAQERGMSFKAKLNYKPKVYPVRDPAFVKRESGLGVSDIREYEKKHQTLYSPACLQLWTAPQVNWDGKLLGCCVNHFGDFGNVLEQGLSDCLQSERYQYAKQMVLGQKPPREDIPCTHCKRYQRVKQMPFRKTVIQHYRPR